ncbi:PREDICTED: uncharacterized protein LOC104588768 [Nelumbo nucifera]|uniref:Uncharacterized protein LOC104588768 n=1 Tax=Nelumbo nucifera TaxID=4432 RepID=A0A1U7YZQ6_NELNU|nr:PREDICTED: uncharacterized protein LOC104588768 [Nelumbo nucifera]
MEFLKKALKYIGAKEALAEDNQEREIKCNNEPLEKKRKRRDHCNNNCNRDNKKPPASTLAYSQYTPLNYTRTQILMQVNEEKYMKWPRKMKRNPKRGNLKKYYKYHSGTDHDTEGCYKLKNEIESLIQRKHLNKFVRGPAPKNPKSLEAPKKPKYLEALIFIDEDLKGIIVPYDDALVVSAIIANFVVKRIFVDSGSSANILFYEVLEKMKLVPECLQPADIPLVGFFGNVVKPEGRITLPITVGAEPHQVTWMNEFLVVRIELPYNTIMGRLTLHALKVVMSSYHLALKLLIEHSIGVIRRDQQVARQCYVAALKGKNKETLSLESLDLREELASRGQLAEDLVSVPLDEANPKKTIRVGSNHPP